jgi:hypothetical protein
MVCGRATPQARGGPVCQPTIAYDDQTVQRDRKAWKTTRRRWVWAVDNLVITTGVIHIFPRTAKYETGLPLRCREYDGECVIGRGGDSHGYPQSFPHLWISSPRSALGNLLSIFRTSQTSQGRGNRRFFRRCLSTRMTVQQHVIGRQKIPTTTRTHEGWNPHVSKSTALHRRRVQCRIFSCD